jgi:hypothetical protein
MAQNTKPVFALLPETARAVITTATTDKSGATTTNLVELVEAATDGTKVTRISYKHVGTSTAGTFMVFITDTSGAISFDNENLTTTGNITALDWDGNVGARMLFHMCGVFAKSQKMIVGNKIKFNR